MSVPDYFMVYRIQVIISVYINIGGFCKLELFGKEIVIYTSCTCLLYTSGEAISKEADLPAIEAKMAELAAKKE